MSDIHDPRLLRWYEELACPVCGGPVNSWDKRISRALGYKSINRKSRKSPELSLRGERRQSNAEK